MSPGERAVFLSYASQDAEAAARICEGLRAAGVEVWFDQNALRGGDVWDAAIRKQIKTCALFVPVISQHTRERDEGYFRLEWKLAIDRSHLMATTKAFLLPVVIDDTRDNEDGVPDRFREIQWTRLPGGANPEAFAARVSRLLAPEAAPAPAASATAARSGVPPGDAGGGASFGSKGRRVSYGSRVLLGILAFALIALVYFALDRFVFSKRASAPSPALASVAPTGAVSDKSIAVLPFTDLSEKRDQEYFSDGLAEELLDLLANTAGLHVIGRTSSFYFKGKQATAGEIGRTLGVANILEGSVRKSGNRLRVTTQLIRADSGEERWSETYDRDQEDIFKLQDDIARAVVAKLRATLLGSAPNPETAASNPEAHNLYLLGRYNVEMDTPEGTGKAVDYYRRAIGLDPTYAAAWAKLGEAILRQVANGYVPVQSGLAEAMMSARKAVELDPNLADAYLARASLRMAADFDWQGARADFDQALRLDPGSIDAQYRAAWLPMILDGNVDKAIAGFRHALESDPLNVLRRRYLGRALFYAGHLEEAESTIRQVLALNPSFPAAHYELGRILLARGRIPEALSEFEAEKSTAWRSFGFPIAYHAAGLAEKANAALQEQVKVSDGSEFQLAETYATFGNIEQAFVWLNKAVDRHDPGLQWLRGDPMLRNLPHDRRYTDLFHRINLSP
jgi:TolB-like protein/tetratricopeptide (TPR) repeat protein